jgi:hypothetical protein
MGRDSEVAKMTESQRITGAAAEAAKKIFYF